MKRLLKSALLALSLSAVLFSCANPSSGLDTPKPLKPTVSVPQGYTPSANAKSVESEAEGKKVLESAMKEVMPVINSVTHSFNQTRGNSTRLQNATVDKEVETDFINFVKNNPTFENHLASKAKYKTEVIKLPKSDSKNGILTINGGYEGYATIASVNATPTMKIKTKDIGIFETKDFTKLIEDYKAAAISGTKLETPKLVKSLNCNLKANTESTEVEITNSNNVKVALITSSYIVTAFFDDGAFNGIVEMVVISSMDNTNKATENSTSISSINFFDIDGNKTYTYTADEIQAFTNAMNSKPQAK